MPSLRGSTNRSLQVQRAQADEVGPLPPTAQEAIILEMEAVAQQKQAEMIAQATLLPPVPNLNAWREG